MGLIRSFGFVRLFGFVGVCLGLPGLQYIYIHTYFLLISLSVSVKNESCTRAQGTRAGCYLTKQSKERVTRGKEISERGQENVSFYLQWQGFLAATRHNVLCEVTALERRIFGHPEYTFCRVSALSSDCRVDTTICHPVHDFSLKSDLRTFKRSLSSQKKKKKLLLRLLHCSKSKLYCAHFGNVYKINSKFFSVTKKNHLEIFRA